MAYRILPIPALTLPELNSRFTPDKLPAAILALDEAAIDQFPWDENGYRPLAFARVGWCAQGLTVVMYAKESNPRTQETQLGGAVCQDACLEFFFDNGAGGPYLNLEMNARGVYHMGVGEGRHNRTVFHTATPGVRVAGAAGDEWWCAAAALDAAFLRETALITLSKGVSLRGNFYKCGDLMPQTHYGAFYPPSAPRPDFHRPECFGALTLA